MTLTIDANLHERIERLEPTRHTALVHYLEYLEWLQHQRMFRNGQQPFLARERIVLDFATSRSKLSTKHKPEAQV